MVFTEAEFLSASEKEKVYKNWTKFVDWLVSDKRGTTEGSDYGSFDSIGIRLFTDRVYKHLSLHCGFIAHYSRHGFFGTYFMSGQDTETFFDNLVSDGGYGDTQDLTQAMIAYYETKKSQIAGNVEDEIDNKMALLDECVKRAKTDKAFARQLVGKLL